MFRVLESLLICSLGFNFFAELDRDLGHVSDLKDPLDPSEILVDLFFLAAGFFVMFSIDVDVNVWQTMDGARILYEMRSLKALIQHEEAVIVNTESLISEYSKSGCVKSCE